MTEDALLLWARGPGFTLAATLFAFGITVRLVEILWLRRAPDLARPRGSALGQGLRTVFSRFLPQPGLMARAPVVHVAGYALHLALFVVVFLYAPHIALVHDLLGVSWPALPGGVSDLAAIVAIGALAALMAARRLDPVKRLLTTAGDHLAWTLTLLPLITGFAAVHRWGLPFDTLLALHVLSVDLLLALAPFTKLAHAVTFVLARFFGGAIAGAKGAHS